MRIRLNTLFIMLLLFSSLAAATEPLYSVSFKDWPEDIILKINNLAPELKRKDLTAAELNTVLKRLDESFNFNTLRLLRTDTSQPNALVLVGEISPEIKVRFDGLSGLSEAEAMTTMGLNLSNLLDEESLKAGAQKLTVHYRERGYRSAHVQYAFVSESTLVKTVLFTIDKKEQTELRKIVVEGLADQKLLAQIDEALRRKFRKATLTQDTLNKITLELRTRLSTAGYYLMAVPPPQIQFTANDLTAQIIYKMPESQRYHIEVTNTRAYTHDSLEEDILKLKTYYSKDDNLGSDLSSVLKTHYITNGYPHVGVLYYETKINDRIFLYLNVDEGPYTQINDFRIIGQFSRPEKFYKDKFFELASAPIQEKMYIKEDIETAAKNLLIYLQNDGFVNAKLSRIFISTDHDQPQKGVVVLQIEEGAQVKIHALQFNGVSDVNLESVKKASSLAVNQNLSLAQLEKSIADIKIYYQSQGYLEYALANEKRDLIQYEDNNGTADLKFDIQEGPQVTAQTIEVEGNTRTKTKMILLELDFTEKEILTPAKIEESVLRLQRTGYFNSVEITTLEKDSTVAQRTVIVKVAERDPGLRVLGVGVTDENRGTLHGYAGVAYRNFFGRGVGLSLRAEANYNFASIRFLEHKQTIGGFWPYIFDTRLRFRVSATRSTSITDITVNKVTEANTAIFSLEQDITSHITGVFSYSVNTFVDHGISNEDELRYGYTSESLVIGSLIPAVEFDYRDNIFNPTKGHFSRVSFEWSPEGLGNNNVDEFSRVTGETTVYFPLHEAFVFAQSLRAGSIRVNDKQGVGVPFDKRGFILGGRNTIRGFESSEFFPSTQEIGASFRLHTGSDFKLAKSELRFPLSVKYDLAAAFFYDGGQVSIEGLDLVDKWRDAAGVGIRYNTPVGPLSLEYGHKLNKKAGESDGAFHLSFGVF